MTSTTTIDVTTSQSTSTGGLITDDSGCFFENGYLELISGSKYKPKCQNGFELRVEIKTLKCKNGKMNVTPECIASDITTTPGSVE